MFSNTNMLTMVTMKSYTDLQQSKRLAEILPLDSADMSWCNSSIKGINYIDPWHTELKTPIEIESIFNEAFVSDWKTWWKIVPCWSVSALLEIIRNNGRYELQMYEGGYYFEANGFMTESYFNPIDACYNMILQLHEQKLI